MRVLGLTVFNLGVFRGRHHFDFATVEERKGKLRHLVVVSGHNGVGKSTLFQSFGLALHGLLSLGDRTSRAEYNKYLFSRLHRYAGIGVQNTSREAGVELRFEYVQSGKPLRVEVKWQWHRNGSNVTETLHVLCDGKPPDMDAEYYQTWLSKLIPVGLAPLCFFDAEHLDAMAGAQSHGTLMGESLRRLLGLDLVERLQSDLEPYIAVQKKL